MCGINGFNFQDKKLIKLMNNSIKHRGNDASGIYADKNISLGHQRLSIIDLSEKGNQPMAYSFKGKKAVIVYNGEVYNFQELRKDLQKKGYKFKTETDTEVILASYFEYGFDCVKKFNGMWAFCIYDLNKKILFLSRDRFGKKPLYYYFNGKSKRFIFSSEIKGILKHKIKTQINPDAIDLYFALGFIPGPYSVYRDIYKLEARQNLIFDLSKKTLEKNIYYDFQKYSPINNKKTLINEGKKLLKDAVKLRLIADVPVGAFLSGGLDSSAVVAEMSSFVDLKNLNTFSIGFEGEFDESQHAEKIKRLFNTKHHGKYFTEKNFKELLDRIFYFYDEPFADYSMFPTYFLSEFARKYVKVSLSGDGGDEIFGGYPRHQKAMQIVFLKKIPVSLRKFFLKILSKINCKKLSNLKEGIRVSLLPLEFFYSEIRPEIYKPEVYKKLVNKNFKECLKLAQGNFVQAVILMDLIYNTLPDNYLVKVDRASMANALEVRCPFLDYRLIEYSLKIPVKLKVSKFQTKVLMKEMLKSVLPEKILKRKKTGFTPPIAEWLSKPSYLNEIKKAMKELYEQKIISKEWVDFYENYVFKNSNIIAKNYKVRLFLFYKWLEFWRNAVGNM